VDVVLGVAWTDATHKSHPGNAMLSALSPDHNAVPDYNTFFVSV
jgi:hypothetical protein